MARLGAVTSDCCTTEQQAGCCEPSEKGACCAPKASSAEGADARAADSTEVRERVRERYAAAAVALADSSDPGCGCAVDLEDGHGSGVFGASLYRDQQTPQTAPQAVAASLGCGVPTAVADLREGETVLDLGSGAGADVLLSARRVAPTGKAIGLDMTDGMLELARRNAEEAGIANVEFRKGYIEDIPLSDASVDVVISNCVLNLSGDKPRVLREAARVLRPGGRFAISDVIADGEMDDATRADMRQWTGCIAGALNRLEFENALAGAGLIDVEIRETHRVHEQAAAAIIRARMPATPAPLGSAWRPVDETALPIAPACALDERGLRQQLQRYGRVAAGASLIERTPQRMTVELDDRVDGRLVEELLAIERECCSFLDLRWEPGERRLTFAIPGAEHEPVLEGISLALGLDIPANR